MTQPTTIAHYRIVSKLGDGGMGAVYRARDTRLNRDVAIKVLPPAFAEDSARVERFEREAQVLASLNHPNIAAIYGVEAGAIVMELVEGPELAGPLPVDTVIDYARQIAGALEAAHEKGIVHRDLKPANIKVTPAGVVKLLDFGLAKGTESPQSGALATQSPTLSLAMTQAGMIMGTAGYMAPEQAAGKPVDKRADIWAFGVVLYEMLMGSRLFEGETIAHTLADVLRAEIDLSKLPAATPAPVRALIARCLDRNPRTRLRDIGEARIAFDAAPSPEAPSRTPIAGARTGLLPWVMVGVLALCALASGWVAWKATRRVEVPLSRFRVDLGPGAIRGAALTAALSPDGRRIVYTLRGADGLPVLATRLLQESAPAVLPGTENGEQPFFSPDGQWIGFFASLQMKKISVYGGAPVILCPASAPPRGAAWGANGYIIANLDNQHLFRVPESGGKAALLGDPEAVQGRSWRWPQVFGAGRFVIFTAGVGAVGTGYDEANIDVLSLKTGSVKTVARGGYFGRYLPSGHIAYIHQGSLFAAPFDIDRLEASGAAVPVLTDVAAAPTVGAGQFSFSDSGAFVYLDGKAAGTVWQLSWIDMAGKSESVWSTPNGILSPKVSPDGKLLVGSVDEGIVVYDPQRSAATKLTSSRGRSCIWAPDGKHLAYSGGGGSPEELGIWWVRADGSSQPQLLFSGKTLSLRVTSFTPDGRRLAFWMARPTDGGSGGRPEIWTMTLDLRDPDRPHAEKPELFLTGPGGMSDPAISPDGRWIAYTANESGSHAPEVFVRPYPGGSGSGQWQISNAGGGFPVWSRKSSELLYKSILGGIMAVEYRIAGDALVATKPRPTPIRAANMGSAMSFDLAPDGKRFIVTRAEAPVDEGPIHVTFLLNFFDELKRKVP